MKFSIVGGRFCSRSCEEGSVETIWGLDVGGDEVVEVDRGREYDMDVRRDVRR